MFKHLHEDWGFFFKILNIVFLFTGWNITGGHVLAILSFQILEFKGSIKFINQKNDYVVSILSLDYRITGFQYQISMDT